MPFYKGIQRMGLPLKDIESSMEKAIDEKPEYVVTKHYWRTPVIAQMCEVWINNDGHIESDCGDEEVWDDDYEYETGFDPVANITAGVRTMMAATHPANAAPGTIRGDFATELSENVVHGSDSKASAKRRTRSMSAVCSGPPGCAASTEPTATMPPMMLPIRVCTRPTPTSRPSPCSWAACSLSSLTTSACTASAELGRVSMIHGGRRL